MIERRNKNNQKSEIKKKDSLSGWKKAKHIQYIVFDIANCTTLLTLTRIKYCIKDEFRRKTKKNAHTI